LIGLPLWRKVVLWISTQWGLHIKSKLSIKIRFDP
jgi:hypothetical protein